MGSWMTARQYMTEFLHNRQLMTGLFVWWSGWMFQIGFLVCKRSYRKRMSDHE